MKNNSIFINRVIHLSRQELSGGWTFNKNAWDYFFRRNNKK